MRASPAERGQDDSQGAARAPGSTTKRFRIRPGSAADACLMVGLFDEAVRWMVASGLSGQWGSQPFSADPRRVDAVSRWADSGGLLVAEHGGVPVAGMVLGDAPAYAPPAAQPELYVVALVAARTPHARGAGRFLLAEAERTAAARGVPTLRLDCYAGNGGALTRYYRGAGFQPTDRFSVGGWPGQVLQKDIGS